MLLYSLCTTTKEESQDVVADFLQRHPMFTPIDLSSLVAEAWQSLFDDKGQLVTRTGVHDQMDCFFAAGFYCQPECSF
jgi:16S rRNA (cytosine967-C5)-methyltransferase